MASIKFEVLSNSQTAPIYLRLSFRNSLKDYVVESKTQITCSKEDWKIIQKKLKRP